LPGPLKLQSELYPICASHTSFLPSSFPKPPLHLEWPWR